MYCSGQMGQFRPQKGYLQNSGLAVNLLKILFTIKETKGRMNVTLMVFQKKKKKIVWGKRTNLVLEMMLLHGPGSTP